MGPLNAIAFDKTGTLTEGVPVVTVFHLFNEAIEEYELLAIVTALEKYSQHPLASAIIRKSEESKISYKDILVENFTSITGKGIQGTIDGQTYYVGNPNLFKEVLVFDLEKEIEDKITNLQDQGKTAMLIGTNDDLLAVIAVADEVRDSSKEIIRELHDMGVQHTIMLTGDNQGTAKAIAEEVGDGINDAPALAVSTVGIAMGGAGTDTVLETADVALMGDNLRKLPFAIKLSRKALNIIKANITFAIAIKIVALLLVIPGWLTLWIAILSDMGATVLVALNGMRLMRVEE